MSIQSEINRISGNVSDALDAIEEKGVTIPSGANSDDLATLIGQISGGGGGGTGTITQDQDGYLVLSPDGGGGGGGLEYEEGTWTPTADTTSATITFSNPHSSPPMAAFMFDSSPDTMGNSGSDYFGGCTAFIGGWINNITGASNPFFGVSRRRDAGGGESRSSFNSLTAASDFVTSTQFRPQGSTVGDYWRAGRTYKWIAVWPPTT